MTKTVSPTATSSAVSPLRSQRLELRHHLLVVEDRPGDQVGEVGDEQAVIDRIVLLGLAAVSVDQEGDLGEGVERDPDRQEDAQRLEIDARQAAQREQQEVGIFEEGEQQEVAADTQAQQKPPRCRCAAAA